MKVVNYGVFSYTYYNIIPFKKIGNINKIKKWVLIIERVPFTINKG